MLSVCGLCVPTGFGVQVLRRGARTLSLAGDDVATLALKTVGFVGV